MSSNSPWEAHGSLHLVCFIISCLQTKSALPFPKSKHDPPLVRIQDAVGYIILWPWIHKIHIYGVGHESATSFHMLGRICMAFPIVMKILIWVANHVYFNN
jgi:hypothetical protein